MYLIDFIAGLQSQNTPFVSYRLPHSQQPVTLAGGKFIAERKKAGTSCFVLAPFHPHASLPVRFYQPVAELQGWDISIDPKTIASHKTTLASHQITAVSTDFSEYSKQFRGLMKQLKSGRLQKAVLSRVIKTQLGSTLSATALFEKLEKKYPSAFVYLFFDGSGSLWLGATPELLLNTDRKTGRTVALAGTQHIGTLNPDILNWGDKERSEQQFVVEYIKDRLSIAGIKDISIGEARTIAAGKIAHLQTDFSFKLGDGTEPLDLALMLHPTPAVCGMPAQEAFDTIISTEKHDREYYTGFLGPIQNNGQTHLFVNLRCMKIVGTTAVIYVGGGLTAGSELKKEWEETQLKAQTLLAVIQE